MNDFIFRALIAGFAVAVVGGVLGCFVVWRRMAYFGDALAHSSLLGVAFGLLLGINFNIGILLTCFTFAVCLVWLQQQRFLASDTLLGILAHSMLAIGIITLSLLPSTNLDLHSYLFGNILTVTSAEIAYIAVGGVVALGLLRWQWSNIVLMTIHEDLAKSEGVNIFRTRLLLVFLMTLIIALSVLIVGALLVMSLLIIPAATARQFSNSPEKMAVAAAGIGVIMVFVGIFASVHIDIPSGPSIVAVGAFLFGVVVVARHFFVRRR